MRARRFPRRRVLVAALWVVAAQFAWTGFHAGAALAACNENGSLFWAGANNNLTIANGNQQALTVRTHTAGGCSGGGVVAGGTVHMTGPPGGSLVEIGWRDETTSSGSHFYRLFTEHCIGGGGCVVAEYSSGCATNGTVVVEKVTLETVPVEEWQFHYKCNGGGFSALPSYNNPNFIYGSPRVETFRFGPAGGGGFILDFHDSLTVAVQSEGFG
jgi:hypothetical protein